MIAADHFKIADLGIAVDTSLANVQGRMRTGRQVILTFLAFCFHPLDVLSPFFHVLYAGQSTILTSCRTDVAQLPTWLQKCPTIPPTMHEQVNKWIRCRYARFRLVHTRRPFDLTHSSQMFGHWVVFSSNLPSSLLPFLRGLKLIRCDTCWGTCVGPDRLCRTRVENGISLDEIETRAATLHLPHRYSDKLNNHVMWLANFSRPMFTSHADYPTSGLLRCFAVNPSNRPTSRDLIMTSKQITLTNVVHNQESNDRERAETHSNAQENLGEGGGKRKEDDIERFRIDLSFSGREFEVQTLLSNCSSYTHNECFDRTFISKQSQHFILGDDDSVRLRSSVPIRSGPCKDIEEMIEMMMERLIWR
eukprot:762548-Hanusia_phi.AAC.2